MVKCWSFHGREKMMSGFSIDSKIPFTDCTALFGVNSREFLLFQLLSFFFSFSQVGLAVGDIESVQKYAFLRNKGKFVDFVVGVERNLPKFVTRRLHKPELVVTGRYVDRKISSG